MSCGVLDQGWSVSIRLAVGAALRRCDAARVARLVPAALAAYELRDLLATGAATLGGLGHQLTVAPHLWLLALLGVGAGLMLREMGRGLPRRRSGPRWSAGFVGRWLACSVMLLVLLRLGALSHAVSTGAPVGLLGGAGWSAPLAAACIGLLVATAVDGARWVLRVIVRRHGRPCTPTTGPAVRAGYPDAQAPPGLAPLADGWSSRGPPAVAVAVS